MINGTQPPVCNKSAMPVVVNLNTILHIGKTGVNIACNLFMDSDPDKIGLLLTTCRF